MNRIDLSKLPAPQLIEELDYESILSQMRTKMREICPEWTGYELESDPANKILEVAAYREMLLRQRVNEAARGVMIAFATGSDLDHLAAFYGVTRLMEEADEALRLRTRQRIIGFAKVFLLIRRP